MADLDIAAFLRARLDEREAVALAAQGTTEGRWKQENPVHAYGLIVDDYGDTVTYDEGAPSEAQAVHIVDNDPKFVLADVAAKRQIIELHRITYPGPDEEPIYGNHWEHVNVYNDDGSIRGDREFCVENDEPDPPRYCVACHDECTTLPLLALPYAGHPDYREDWKP